jgi:hypothetical protein
VVRSRDRRRLTTSSSPPAALLGQDPIEITRLAHAPVEHVATVMAYVADTRAEAQRPLPGHPDRPQHSIARIGAKVLPELRARFSDR